MTIFDVVASNMLVALESGSASAVTAADWASVISAMTAQISVATIVGVMATIVAACIGIVFMWWGVRKAVRALMAAFRKGKISV
ncbi:MAG: hypothetical protein ACLTV4_03880 [Ruthenibacterium lactatiformans]|jgi:hypothetical protein